MKFTIAHARKQLAIGCGFYENGCKAFEDCLTTVVPRTRLLNLRSNVSASSWLCIRRPDFGKDGLQGFADGRRTAMLHPGDFRARAAQAEFLKPLSLGGRAGLQNAQNGAGADFCTPTGILNLLFWMEEEIPIRLHEAEDDGAAHVAVSFQMERLDALLKGWKDRRERFLSGEISAEEYGTWKFCRAENDWNQEKTTTPK